MALRVPRLGRGFVPRLRAVGLLEPKAIRAAGETTVRKVLGHGRVADALWNGVTVGNATRVEAAAPTAPRTPDMAEAATGGAEAVGTRQERPYEAPGHGANSRAAEP